MPKLHCQVFSTLMHHQVKLDASFTSLVIAVAIVEVTSKVTCGHCSQFTSTLTCGHYSVYIQGLGRSLDNKLDLVARALPHLTRAQLDQGRKAV